ncbi:MAG: hypothetical protein HUJ63_03080, partial [Enterococcus sp.]|nr:hypothetical protein [Enterococcus sp.]
MTVYKSNNESSRNQRDLHYVNDAERRSKQRSANFQRVGEHTTKIYIDKKYETQSWSQSQQRKNPKIESFRTAPATPNRRPIYGVENTAQAASQRRRRVYTVEGPELIEDAGRRNASSRVEQVQPETQNTRRTSSQ